MERPMTEAEGRILDQLRIEAKLLHDSDYAALNEYATTLEAERDELAGMVEVLATSLSKLSELLYTSLPGYIENGGKRGSVADFTDDARRKVRATYHTKGEER